MGAVPEGLLEQELVKRVSRDAVKVPPYPAVAMKIEQLVHGGDFGLDEVARLVASDQALAASVLRMANSVAASRGSRIASVEAAVTRLGARDVSRLTLAAALERCALGAGTLAPLRRDAWIDAIVGALLCQALARGRGIAGDVAFAAGLLHDFGKVLAIAAIEELIEEQGAFAPCGLEHWSEVVERFHVELGMVLAVRWDLPPVIADAISLHHGRSIARSADARVVELVEAVDEVNGMLRRVAAVGTQELGAAELLTDAAEAEAVVAVLEGLPHLVGSFDGPSATWRAECGFESPPAPLDFGAALPAAAGLDVAIPLGGRRRTYRVGGIHPAQLMIRGSEPLPLHLLVEVELGARLPLRVLAKVRVCWQERSEWLVILQPFALTGQPLSRWRELASVAGGASAA